MNATRGTALALILLGLASSSHAGDITGRITIKGTPPPERPVGLGSEVELAAKYPKGLTTRHYRVGPEGGLRDVLVYLRGAFDAAAFDSPSTLPVLDHADGFFEPQVLGIRAGQQLKLECTDGTVCSFHATAKANQEFSIAPMQGAVLRAFEHAEVPVRFKCDLHPWNHAYVGVFAHPFFAVTDAQGRFTIRGIPAGKHTLEVFHPRCGLSAKPVEVTEGATTVGLEVEAK